MVVKMRTENHGEHEMGDPALPSKLSDNVYEITLALRSIRRQDIYQNTLL